MEKIVGSREVITKMVGLALYPPPGHEAAPTGIPSLTKVLLRLHSAPAEGGLEMFNALQYSKDLEAAGFSRQQAEATIEVFFKFMEHNFATKKDIEKINTELTDIRHSIEALGYKMTIKFGMMQTATVIFLAALIKLT